MNRDKQLKKQFQNTKYVCPQNVSDAIDATLRDLRDSGRQKKTHSVTKILRLAAAVCVLAFLILPNTSATVAHAMQQIPIVGELVKVITVRQYQVDDSYHPQQVDIPEIVEDLPGAQLINASIKELTDRALYLFNEECKSFPDSHTGIIIDYEVVSNTKDWFTLKIMIHHEAGSSTTKYKYYHIDKATGDRVSLSDLFVDDFDYVAAISQNIKEQMIQRNEELGSNVYWVDHVSIKEWNFLNIDPDQNYYFDAHGALIIVFDKYQVAPGYMGAPQFTVPEEIYRHALE